MKSAQHDAKVVWSSLSQCEDPKATVLVESALTWFDEHPDALNGFLSVLRRQSDFSLRLIDWLTTNYSRRHRVTTFYQGLPVDIHDDYRRHLGVFTKRFFDPFARRDRLHVTLREHTFSTTVGQLNFMKWLFEKQIDHILRQHKSSIEQDMRRHETRRKEGEKAADESGTPTLLYVGSFHLRF